MRKYLGIAALVLCCVLAALTAPAGATLYPFDDFPMDHHSVFPLISMVDQDIFPNAPYDTWIFGSNVGAITQETAAYYGWKGISGIGLIGVIDHPGAVFEIDFPWEAECASFLATSLSGGDMSISVNGVPFVIGSEPKTLWVYDFNALKIEAGDWFAFDDLCTYPSSSCPIPVPPTLWLVVSGLLALTWRRGKKG